MTGWLPDAAAEWNDRPVLHKVADVAVRHRASLEGVVRRVHAPEGSVAGFDAWLDDGTGEIVLRWVGRASVPGVVPGAFLRVEGTVAEAGGVPLILNPLYRFEPEGSSRTSTSW